MFLKGDNIIQANINRILLIQLGDIGDVVLTFPCIRALREHFPKAEIMLAARDTAAELLDLCPWATGCIVVSKRKEGLWQNITFQKEFFSRLRRHRFDLAIDMRTGQRGAILAFLSGARQRIGFFSLDDNFWRDRIFTNIYRADSQSSSHMAEYLLNMFAAYGIQTEHGWPELVVPVAMQEKVTKLLQKENVPTNRPLVALQPFSLWGYKEWGTEKCVQLIRWIQSSYNLPVLVTGAGQERKRAKTIVEASGGETYNFAGRTSIGLYAALLHRCSLFIGVDSAGQHLAAGTGVATVILYGPSPPSCWAPKGEKHVVVQKKLACVPCCRMGCDDSRKSRCMDELTVDEVIPYVRQQLETKVGIVTTALDSKG